MSNLADTLYSLVGFLDELSIRYAVMGGVAVRAYGVPRATYDIDLTIGVDRARLPELFVPLKANRLLHTGNVRERLGGQGKGFAAPQASPVYPRREH